MKKLVNITFNDLRIIFRERAIFINLVFIPVALIIVLGAVQGGWGSSNTPLTLVDVVDLDNSDLSAALIETAGTINSTLTLCPLAGHEVCRLDATAQLDETQIQQRIAAGISSGALIIPAGFSAAVLAGETVTLLYYEEGEPLQPSTILPAFQAASGRLAAAAIAAQVGTRVYGAAGFAFAGKADRAELRASIYERAWIEWQKLPALVAYREGEQAEEASGPSAGGGFGQSVPGMGTMYVMFTVLAGAPTLIWERKNWTLQRLVMLPVTRAQLLGGKALARFLMGMVQYSIAFATGLLLGINFGNNVFALIALMMAFTAAIAGLAFLLATLVDNEQQAASSMTFLALTLAPLGGAWWPLEIVPDFMRTFAYLSPVGWVMEGFTRLIFYGAGLGDVLLNIVILLTMAGGFFALAIWRFRYA